MKIKKQKNGMVNYFDEKYRFIEFWNPTNGFYARTNVLDENGKETDKEAFMRSFPALIDVGIMG